MFAACGRAGVDRMFASLIDGSGRTGQMAGGGSAGAGGVVGAVGCVQAGLVSTQQYSGRSGALVASYGLSLALP